MTQDDLGRVFDRFVRRDDGGGTGTGLGLSIVRSLVDLQGGSIDVKSTVDEGTIFTVLLPAEPAGHQEAPRHAIRGKRVLVVDDEEEVARAIAAGLEPYGVTAEIATDGDQALERLRSDRFDAITLDMMIEGKSGLDVLRALRADENLRRTPVVIVSIASDHQALLGEWKVTKPVEPDVLADALGSAVLAGRTRVLVVGRSSVRPDLEPALLRLGSRSRVGDQRHRGGTGVPAPAVRGRTGRHGDSRSRVRAAIAGPARSPAGSGSPALLVGRRRQ